MSKKKNLVWLLSLVFFVFGFSFIVLANAQDQPPAPAEKPAEKKLLYDDWYEIMMYDQKVAYEHSSLYETTYEGKKAFLSSSESKSDRKIRGNRNTSQEKEFAYLSEEYKPLYYRSEQHDSTQVKITELKIEANKFVFISTIDNIAQTKKIDYEKDAYLGVSGLLLKKLDLLKVGTKKSFRVVSPSRQKTITEFIEVTKKEKVRCMDKEVECFVIESTNDDVKDIKMTVWTDENGNDIKAVDNTGILAIKVTEEKAKEFKEIADFDNEIEVRPLMPFKKNINQLDLIITVKEDDKHNIFPDNSYHKVKFEDGKYVMSLLSQFVDPKKKAKKIPVKDKNLDKYLKPCAYIQCTDPEIVKMAKEIVGSEKDSLKATQLICHWVYKNIKKEISTISSASATETLKMRAGDCTEHSALVCALTRAVGIPSRDVGGLVFTGNSFGYHAWSEVYIGYWIPVDATIDIVGIPGAYIMLGYEDETGASGESISRMRRMFYRANIKCVKVNRNKEEIDLSDKKFYITETNEYYENKLMGLKAQKTAGWSFKEDTRTGTLIFKQLDEDGKDHPLNAFFVETGISGPSYDEFADMLKKALESDVRLEVNLKSKTPIKFKDLDAMEIVVTIKGKANALAPAIFLRLIIVNRGDTMYRLVGRAVEPDYENFKKQMDEALNKFEFTTAVPSTEKKETKETKKTKEPKQKKEKTKKEK